MTTAAIIVCTNRLQLALRTLAALDAQCGEVDVYLVCNSTVPEFRCRLMEFGLDMKKTVVFLGLAAQHINIGLAVNCGIWHALHSANTYDGILKIDDDIGIPPDAIDRLWQQCDGTNIVAYPPFAEGKPPYDDPEATRKATFHNACTLLYGSCVLIPGAVLNDCGYWAENAPRGAANDYSMRAHGAGHETIYDPVRTCARFGSCQPRDADERDNLMGRSALSAGVGYRITAWNDSTTRGALLADRCGWRDPEQSS